MTRTFPKGVCSGCREERQVTADGFIRRHNAQTGSGVCSGADQPPLDDGTPPVAKRQIIPPGTRLMPSAPTEPTYGRSCDGGGCDNPSVGWRLYRGLREWLPVCGTCMGTAPERARFYDRDLEGATP